VSPRADGIERVCERPAFLRQCVLDAHRRFGHNRALHDAVCFELLQALAGGGVTSQVRRRLAAEAGGDRRRLAAAAAGRLLGLLQEVRQAWAADSAGAQLGSLRAHVSRSLAAMEASAAALDRPGADVSALNRDFREAGVPLVFFLRGLEGAGERSPLDWLEPAELSRTA